MLGDKQKIHEQIAANYEKKKNEEVEGYISRNLKDENTVKANHSSWYDQAKLTLFSKK